jgi:PTS system nitrogen regulatory IIA component
MDLKIKEVAELLNVSETTIRRWLLDGKIPAYKINHQYRFNRSEIEHWVLGQKLGVDMGASPFGGLPSKEKTSKGGSLQFSLYRAVHKGGVLHDIAGKTKEEIIRATMKLVAKDIEIDADVSTELLIERENLQPTALNHGIGIPHTRDTLLNNHFDAVTIVFPKEPIPYGALDGEAVHTLFFLFACDDKRHLHLLAKIAHLSSQPEVIKFLRTKPSKELLLEFIKEWESNIQKAPA